MKTQEEITALKLNWHKDPIWDIETTEGFEDHRQELLDYRIACELQWKEDHDRKHSAAGLIEAAGYNLDRALDDRICQIAEQHTLLALAQATLAQASFLSRIADSLEEIASSYGELEVHSSLQEMVDLYKEG